MIGSGRHSVRRIRGPRAMIPTPRDDPDPGGWIMTTADDRRLRFGRSEGVA